MRRLQQNNIEKHTTASHKLQMFNLSLGGSPLWISVRCQNAFNYSHKCYISRTFLPFQRRNSARTSFPFVRHSEKEPLTNEVELIEANLYDGLVRYSYWNESTISLKDFAPSRDVKLVKLAIIDGGDSKAPFSLTTTRCTGRSYSFHWIGLLYPWYVP